MASVKIPVAKPIEVQDVGTLISFWRHHSEAVIGSIIQVVLIIIAYVAVRFILLNLIDKAVGRTISKVADGGIIPARQARLRALQSIFRSAVGIILGFIAIVMILQAVTGTAPSSLLAAAGVAGLAVGFGAQKLVKDVVSGILILLEDQYGVGDFVTIGAVNGTVEELALRTTRIRDNAGKLYILSNGDIVQVCNHSRGKLKSYLDVSVAPASDVGKAEHILDDLGRKVADEMPDLITEPFKCKGIVNITAEKASIRLIGGVIAGHQDQVIMILNERIKAKFAENDIAFG